MRFFFLNITVTTSRVYKYTTLMNESILEVKNNLQKMYNMRLKLILWFIFFNFIQQILINVN